MATREILQIGNPILRQRSHKITRFDDALSRLVEDMFDSMHEANGIGLAAPQIGISKRLIVVEMPDDKDHPHPGERWVMCNPEIVRASRETVVGQEGCLSVVGYVGMVERAEKVTIAAEDLRGREFRVKAEDYLARAFQHEIDHLNGVLYVEIAEEGSVITLEELEKQAQEKGDEIGAGEPTMLT